MKIYLGADHRGLPLKEQLKPWLTSQGHEVTDCGATSEQADDDYPDYALKVAEAVAQDPLTRGVLICGSGVGMAVAANKVKGVRSALIHDVAIAKSSRNDDDVNVIALGSDHIDIAQAQAVLETWLATAFSKDLRHVRRLEKIKELEG